MCRISFTLNIQLRVTRSSKTIPICLQCIKLYCSWDHYVPVNLFICHRKSIWEGGGELMLPLNHSLWEMDTINGAEISKPYSSF